jgi:hypothetical protein
MKKPKADAELEKIKKCQATYFPERAEAWSEEDHALSMLLIGVRMVRQHAKNPIPPPLML